MASMPDWIQSVRIYWVSFKAIHLALNFCLWCSIEFFGQFIALFHQGLHRMNYHCFRELLWIDSDFNLSTFVLLLVIQIHFTAALDATHIVQLLLVGFAIEIALAFYLGVLLVTTLKHCFDLSCEQGTVLYFSLRCVIV